ncbi:GNAT family N-acetyltransferase [Amantichitinum ursilacus]|uniref:Acetyltransferase (GNAT) family protein n=1 Tax=Amantichitinum ursilacus TaxID=857265 RepID=A0A0N0XGH9_9NEIS|nr:GNAT family N-acetyltransferase [Amantichitinum ursilacus]KPC49795.1 Acetyltransferase (GNAT) family protein [Amantichitinum ursilacus]
MTPFQSERLTLRPITLDDAAFIVQLLNSPGWLQFIGDKNVRNEADAQRYINDGPLAMYAASGFGLWVMVRSEDGALLGMSGLIKRAGLDDVDLGYALLPEFEGQGYASEAAQAWLAWGRDVKNLRRVVAITDQNHTASGRLLQRVGFAFERVIEIPNIDHPLNFYSIAL